MDISYEYDVQDVLINSRKARPEPEPNWRSMYEDVSEELKRVRINNKELLAQNSRMFTKLQYLKDKIRTFSRDTEEA